MDMNKNCEIVESYGIIGARSGKAGPQTLELKLVKWYGNNATLDLRWWSEDRAGKGVTFNAKEAARLRDLLNNIAGDNDEQP